MSDDVSDAVNMSRVFPFASLFFLTLYLPLPFSPVLPHYFRHCSQNPNTLITKFLGMYRVKLYHLRRNVKFVIMNSVYYTDKSLQTFYDLKGSEIGREAKPGQDVLKDNDLRAKLPEEAFNFATDVQARIRAQIASDCNFLERMQIMDYSMLIGVHHIPLKNIVTDARASIAETGFRIRERQNSHRSHGSDSLSKSASQGREQEKNGTLNISKGIVANGTTTPTSVEEDSKRTSASKGNKSASSEEGDSTRKLIKDIRETTSTVTNFEFAGLFEEEDDCSYLEGSERHKQYEKTKNSHRLPRAMADEVEIKKEQTVEQIYWPFHRFYDINGFRRMKPRVCFRCNASPCTCHDQNTVRSWNIPDFVPPLSDRKDGGIMMDTKGLDFPMVWKGPQGDKLYEGKIYFLGIIDILQQYNIRKRVETTYRRLESRNGEEPSCVKPHDYATRFVRFFDEYSAKARPKQRGLGHDDRTEVEVSVQKNGTKTRPNQVDIVVSSPTSQHLPKENESAPNENWNETNDGTVSA